MSINFHFNRCCSKQDKVYFCQYLLVDLSYNMLFSPAGHMYFAVKSCYAHQMPSQEICKQEIGFISSAFHPFASVLSYRFYVLSWFKGHLNGIDSVSCLLQLPNNIQL